MHRHIILLKFKEETTPEQIADVEGGFRAIYESMPGMLEISMGPNVSESQRAKRYDWAMTMDFATRSAYREYSHGEPHDRLVAEKLVPIVAGISGIDYDHGETPEE
ncbi:MAG: Dabb family protein [Chloroflexi bacterium]|nr:Dabb family protein [Chloroflexota bacterium]